VQAQTQMLVGKPGSDDGKITSLANYVQTNSTYKAIEFGRRARIPNKSADVLRNRYGDCKDHALLLQQMLAAAGIPAQLALVSHRGPIQKDLPSLDQFDHMIVYVPGAAGGRFLDCTSKGADVAHSVPVGLAGQDALILDAGGARFVTIPPYPEEASRISVEEHIRPVDRTDLAVEGTLTVSGVHAAFIRDYLLRIPESSRRMWLQNNMGMSDADLKDLQIDSLNTPGEPLRLRFTYFLKKQFRQSANRLRGVLQAGFFRSYLTAGPVDNRVTPFEITIPLFVEAKLFIDAPAGFEAEEPEKLDIKLDPRFATCQSEARIDKGQLRLNFHCREMTGKFNASDYDAYRQTMGQALSSVEREIVFKVAGN